MTDVILPIEVGLIVAGELDEVDSQAVVQVKQELERDFAQAFPQFGWKVELIWRRELARENPIEPMPLIDIAREERDGRDWDFVFVVVAADLRTHYKPFAFAAVSRAMDTAVISTVRIDPRMEDPSARSEIRIESVSRRLLVLIRQAFGQINSLESSDSRNIMGEIHTVADLDALADAGWTEGQNQELAQVLELIADQRLEEASEGRRKGTIAFYLKSSWMNRHEIADAVVKARPWEFPVRLNRLTTAAFSTSLILMITAETWELAIQQTAASLACLAVTAILATTAYVTQRQQLLVRRERRISEQSVITNVSAVGIVLAGMTTMFAVTFALVGSVSGLLFYARVIRHWAAVNVVAWSDYLSLGVFVASFAVIVGALGASFEEHQYFRHITFVDEEI